MVSVMIPSVLGIALRAALGANRLQPVMPLPGGEVALLDRLLVGVVRAPSPRTHGVARQHNVSRRVPTLCFVGKTPHADIVPTAVRLLLGLE